MLMYRFIQRVINSCTNHDQLQSCISWIDSLEISNHMKDAVHNDIRTKINELKNYY